MNSASIDRAITWRVTTMRSKAMRAMAYTLIVCFVNLCLQPLAVAVGRVQLNHARKTSDEVLAEKLEQIAQLARAASQRDAKSVVIDSYLSRIRILQSQVVPLELAVQKQVDALDMSSTSVASTKTLGPTGDGFSRIFFTNRGRLDQLFRALWQADASGDVSGRNTALLELAGHIRATGANRYSRVVDVRHMPWRSEPVTNARKLTSLKGLKVGVNGPGLGDLAATIDAPITSDIAAKAAELGNDPVRIYQWVRNNVRFRPTYGSAQGAQDTLEKLEGNAFDTSSLLIALLRGAGYPARYVRGQINVPAAQIENWLGGTADAFSSSVLLNRGGVPNTVLTAGGQAISIQMEHIWVEAWLSFSPSRGARPGSENMWIPLDASFKQHTISTGMNLASQAPIDQQSLEAALSNGASFDAAAGSIQNANFSAVQALIANYQSNTSNYILTRNASPTLGDVFGSENIIPDSSAILKGGLPYPVIGDAERFDEIPDALRHKFSYKVYASDDDRARDSPILSYTENLPTLVGKKIALTFAAASQADLDLLQSFIPADNPDGTPNLPSTIPALPNVIAELRVDDVVIAQSGPLVLGAQLVAKGGFTSLGLTDWDLTDDNSLVAGQISVIGVSVHGISPRNTSNLQSRMSANLAKIQGSDTTGIVRGALTTDILLQNAYAYYAGDQMSAEISKRVRGMVDIPGLSYGLFQLRTVPIVVNGVTTSVVMHGIELDIGHLRSIRAAKNGDEVAWANYSALRGMQESSLENSTPDMLFQATDPGSSFPSISSMTALREAVTEGQKIYVIGPQNLSSILPTLSVSDTVQQAISDAILAGKIALTSERPITLGDWTGNGFVLLDRETGDGAFLIEGGPSGDDKEMEKAEVAGMFLQGFFELAKLSKSLLGLFGELMAPILVVVDAITLWDVCKSAGSKAIAIGTQAGFALAFAIALDLALALPLLGLILAVVAVAFVTALINRALAEDCKASG